jgi:DNA-binding CsgD family transcriptional regulator
MARRGYFTNDYGTLIEPWKADLIARRAKRLGFPRQDWPDLQQEIVPLLAELQFEADHPDGASEATHLTAVIDNRLRAIRRAASRYVKRIDKLAPVLLGRTVVAYHDGLELTIDVQQTVPWLTPIQQQVCACLAAGKSASQIARKLGCTRRKVGELQAAIRRQFEAFGLVG